MARRARAASSTALRLLYSDSERRRACLACVTRGAGLALVAAASTSHHRRAPQEQRCVQLEHWAFFVVVCVLGFETPLSENSLGTDVTKN